MEENIRTATDAELTERYCMAEEGSEEERALLAEIKRREAKSLRNQASFVDHEAEKADLEWNRRYGNSAKMATRQRQQAARWGR